MATVKSKKTLVGLDIGSTEIKAVELAPSPSSDKGYVISGYGIREINPQQPLKDTIKEMFETQAGRGQTSGG
ncbi:MAG: hypothetical protein HY762_01375 [Planctomycetes bacterium]|nr:hypothetical protein [Planctomycetota bacterium]